MRQRLYPNSDHPDIISSVNNYGVLLCSNPITRSKGIKFLKEFKKELKDEDCYKKSFSNFFNILEEIIQ